MLVIINILHVTFNPDLTVCEASITTQPPSMPCNNISASHTKSLDSVLCNYCTILVITITLAILLYERIN